jgi:hypothetical protein
MYAGSALLGSFSGMLQLLLRSPAKTGDLVVSFVFIFFVYSRVCSRNPDPMKPIVKANSIPATQRTIRQPPNASKASKRTQNSTEALSIVSKRSKLNSPNSPVPKQHRIKPTLNSHEVRALQHPSTGTKLAQKLPRYHDLNHGEPSLGT